LAGNGREPAVRQCKLRRHEIVIIQLSAASGVRILVISHGALARQISKRSAAAAGLGKALSRVHKTIHQHGAGGGEIKAAHVTKALEPRRTHVVKTGAGRVEEREYLSFIILVG